MDKHFKLNYGVSLVDFIEENQNVKLLRLDSYQKELLEFKLCINATTSPVKTKKTSSENFTDNFKLLSNKTDNSRLVYEIVDKNLIVEINQGNLLDQPVEIVVNAANTELNFGGKKHVFF